jgi:hypothetical protein
MHIEPTKLAIPDGLPIWRTREVQERRDSVATKSYTKDGVLYWQSNDRPVPMSVFKEGLMEAPAAQAQACEANTQAFLAEYRRNPPQPSGEEIAEMRANFEPGATVVNVITGRRIKL